MRLNKIIFIFSAALITLLPNKRILGQNVDEIFEKYKNEQAVVSNDVWKLVIKNEDGRLMAKSYVSTEKLLIGELSPGIFNKEYIYHSCFNKLEEYKASALIPGKRGFVKNEPTNTNTTNHTGSDVLFDDVKQTEILFSGLTPKSLLQCNYTIGHTDLWMLPSFYFQGNLPVAKALFEITVPKYVKMNFVVRGTRTDLIKKDTEENKNSITYRFSAKDVPAAKDFNYVSSFEWYELSVTPYVLSYKIPGNDEERVMGDVDHLYAYFSDFIKNVNKTEEATIVEIAAEVTKGDKTEKEKAAHIYQWVQSNIHYVAFEDSLEGYIPRQAAVVMKRKFGDCKDMASVLVALCRQAGLKAYFTWIGTRSKPYTYAEMPVPRVANHMICTVKIGEEWIFMDGTHPLIPFGIPPESLQGKEAMISISDKEYKIITVPHSAPSTNKVIDTSYLKINGRQIAGKIKLHLQGHPSWSTQVALMYRKNKVREEYIKAILERGSNKYIQRSYEYSPSDTGTKPCVIAADFVLDDFAHVLGNEYYINLNLSLRNYFDNNYIDTTERDIPEYFGYMDTEREVVVVDIPDGYHVSYMPPPSSGQVSNIWDYNINYTQDGKRVILSKEYRVHSMTMPTRYFAEHNRAVNALKKQYKERIVLTAN